MLYLNTQHTGVQTLYRGTDRWEVRAYDRAEQYQDRASGREGAQAEALRALADAERGCLRYELQLRSRGLEYEGLRRLDDLRMPHLQAVAEKYFIRSRLNERVGGDAERLAAAATQLSAMGEYKMLAPLLGQLLVEGSGLAPCGSAPTRRRYERRARELGLVAEDLVPQQLSPMRLDFASGELVTGSAAMSPPNVKDAPSGAPKPGSLEATDGTVSSSAGDTAAAA